MCSPGLDLAHAVGNVPLHLHEWQVDFASWCSYKYLNSGAGCLSAIFVHEKHATDFAAFPRLAGWWGVPLQTRFKMAHAFDGAAGASCFGVSNVNPLLVACVYSSLKLFKKGRHRPNGTHPLTSNPSLPSAAPLKDERWRLSCEQLEASRPFGASHSW